MQHQVGSICDLYVRTSYCCRERFQYGKLVEKHTKMTH